jgi:hypothetical protein
MKNYQVAFEDFQLGWKAGLMGRAPMALWQKQVISQGP